MVTFSSPMVATGSSTHILGAYPMHRGLRDRWAAYRVLSSTGCSSALPARRCWPALREFALSSGVMPLSEEKSENEEPIKNLVRCWDCAGIGADYRRRRRAAAGATARAAQA